MRPSTTIGGSYACVHLHMIVLVRLYIQTGWRAGSSRYWTFLGLASSWPEGRRRVLVEVCSSRCQDSGRATFVAPAAGSRQTRDGLEAGSAAPAQTLSCFQHVLAFSSSPQPPAWVSRSRRT